LLHPFLPAVLVSVGTFLLLTVHATWEASAWDAFRGRHDCRPVASAAAPGSWARPGTMVAFRPEEPGWTVTVAPRKTGYECDDGQMYWR